ncbi:MAG: hypothetical protein CVU34_13355 [Betaproteobacteria bacterium HGW-Betaproteobacteria-7]|jgi:hypothetical protein|nr:MAG: hypothetical protein CVU34_13355 [Betaproteobacteria bacterium HGW-Betaproteobacteria-7]
MNEERYASRVRQVLNHGLQGIPPAASRRLEAARHLAVSRQKQAEPELALATAGNWSGSQLLRSGVDFTPFKPFLAIIALLVGMWLAFYWHSTQYVSEIEAVDMALLADDIPPEAFLDNEFIEWLKDDSAAD